MPPWVPLVLVVVVLGGLAWLGSGLLGGGGDKFTVHARSWHGEELEAEAARYARPLKAQAREAYGDSIYLELLRSPHADGSLTYHIVVGKAATVTELAELLEWVQGVTLPDLPAGERPFADAIIAPPPK